ncbi:MAG: hypothetical protein WDN46_01080 [Methylocella sp.]
MAEINSDHRGAFDAALYFARASITVVASCVLLALFIIDFNAISDASQQLLRRAGSVTTLKVFGVELTLDEQAVSVALSEYADRPHRLSAEVAKVISKLKPSEFVRLMEVGQMSGLCEFERPSAKMRADVALDYGLQEKGLTKVADSLTTLADVVAYLEHSASEGLETPNGHPLSCYDLTLTDLGRDVKTALVQSFKSIFDPMHGRGEPPAGNHPLEGDKAAAL